MESNNDNSNYLIFILGPTGIGKTYISLKIASNIKGEIINTDAFSLYKEANILTAKATLEERNKVPHHMIDVIDLFDTKYNVTTYEKEAIQEINKVMNLNKVPVIVGGTNYYVDSLLFNKKISDKIEKTEDCILYTENIKEIVDKIEEIKHKCEEKKENNDTIYQKIEEYLITIDENKKALLADLLKIIDNDYYNFYHQNDIRRITNAISYYFAYNVKKSLMEKNKTYSMKYNKIKIIVLEPENIKSLCKRISDRVEELVTNGISEIIYIFTKFKKHNISISFTAGILQAIGYKEFYPLYEILPQNLITLVYINYSEVKSKELNSTVLTYISQTENAKTILSKCKDELIKNTINYAKYQIKWVNKKITSFLSNYCSIKISSFDKEHFDKDYLLKALDYIKSNDYAIMLRNKENKIIDWQKYFCEICQKTMNGKSEYDSHMKSNTHKKRKMKYNKIKRQIENQKDINSNN